MKTVCRYSLAFSLLLQACFAYAQDASNYADSLRYFRAQPLEKAIQLSWPESRENVSAYRIYRQLSSQTEKGETAALLKELDAGSHQYIDKDIQEEKIYVYFLAVVDEKGEESPRSILRLARSLDVIPPARPKLSSVKQRTGKGDLEFVLSWQKTPDNDVSSYLIYRGMEALQTPVVIARVSADKKPLQYVDHIQKNNIYTWVYAVSAVDYSGNESPLSETLNIRSPDNQAPSPPLISSLAATEKGINIVWQGSVDDDVAAYHIYRKTAQNDNWQLLDKVSDKQKHYLDQVAFSGQRYIYAVSAVDKNNNESHRSKSRSQFSLQTGKLTTPVKFHVRRKGGYWLMNWQPIKDKNLLGYFVYRRSGKQKEFIKISPLIKKTHFKESVRRAGDVSGYRLQALYAQGYQSQPVDFLLSSRKAGGSKK